MILLSMVFAVLKTLELLKGARVFASTVERTRHSRQARVFSFNAASALQGEEIVARHQVAGAQ